MISFPGDPVVKKNVRRSKEAAAAAGMEHIGFTLPSDMKRQLEQRAEDQIVTTSHLLRQLVRAYLRSGASAQRFPVEGSAVGGSRS